MPRRQQPHLSSYATYDKNPSSLSRKRHSTNTSPPPQRLPIQQCKRRHRQIRPTTAAESVYHHCHGSINYNIQLPLRPIRIHLPPTPDDGIPQQISQPSPRLPIQQNTGATTSKFGPQPPSEPHLTIVMASLGKTQPTASPITNCPNTNNNLQKPRIALTSPPTVRLGYC